MNWYRGCERLITRVLGVFGVRLGFSREQCFLNSTFDDNKIFDRFLAEPHELFAFFYIFSVFF